MARNVVTIEVDRYHSEVTSYGEHEGAKMCMFPFFVLLFSGLDIFEKVNN